MTDGRRRPTVWTNPGARNPGAGWLPRRIPPVRSARSSTTTVRPALASAAAAISPLWPAPITTVSIGFTLGIRPPSDTRVSPWSSGRPAALALLLHVFGRGDPSRRAHDAPTRVRRGAAHPEIPNRRPVPGPAGNRSVEEQLFQGELPLEDVALGESGDVLDVLRRDELLPDDVAADVGEALLDRVDHVMPERLALGVVPDLAVGQVIRGVLDEAAHDVVARRRHRGIDQGGDDHVDVGTRRRTAVLRVVVGVLDVVDARRERDRAAEPLTRARLARELGQTVEREVHLAG